MTILFTMHFIGGRFLGRRMTGKRAMARCFGSGLLCALLAGSGVAAAAAQPANPSLVVEDFKGNLNGWKIVLDDGYASPVAQNPRAHIVDVPDVPNEKAMRFALTGSPGEFRSEISLPAEEGFHERTYRASVRVETLPTNPGGQIVMQWHALMGKERVDRDFPNVALWVSDDEWSLKFAYGTPDNIQRRTINLGKAESGKWTEWRFRIHWSPNADGSVTLWQNGVKVYEETAPNCYSGLVERTPYFKTGIYRPSRKVGDNTEPATVVYVKDIEIH